MRLFVRVVLLVLLLNSMTACSKQAVDPPWTRPLPPVPHTGQFDKGDPLRRPVINKVSISQYDVKNGWYIVPWERFRMVANVENAQRVTFHGWGGAPQDGFDPDRNGLIHHGLPPTNPAENPNHWEITSGSYAGQTAGLYVVAENEYGRVVSPVLYVVWYRSSSGSEYSSADLQQP